jgi:Tfp pilus assembly protein PilP
MRAAAVVCFVFVSVGPFCVSSLAAPDPPSSAASGAAVASASPAAKVDKHDAAAQAARTAAAAYKYSGDGRRDPFLSLIGTGGDSKMPPKRTGEGLSAMRVEDVAVRGIVQSNERLVATVQGPDNKSYVVHAGDKLADGVVKSVAADGLVLVQQLSDPLAKEKTREVRKPLRAPNEGKE